MSGENALPTFSDEQFNTMVENAMGLNGPPIFEDLTYLRLSPALLEPKHLESFTIFVQKMLGMRPLTDARTVESQHR